MRKCPQYQVIIQEIINDKFPLVIQQDHNLHIGNRISPSYWSIIACFL